MKILDQKIKSSQHIPEFERLLDIYCNLQPSNILEIGSLMGQSLKHWIHYSVKGSTVISIDLPVRNFCGPGDPRCVIQESAIQNEWPAWAKANNTKLYLIQSESQQPAAKTQVQNILKEKLLDFIFIDGNHFYEYVKQDFEMYLPLVKKGGVIAFHDIGVREEGTVDKLWNEIKQNYKYEEITLHPNKEKGIGVLYL